ncbi:MAG: hypothetical protein SGPRY_004761 [Prymnesium sp.]
MELFCGVPTDTRFLDFCTSHHIENPSNLKRAADPSEHHFAESLQGAYKVHFLQRVDVATQNPVCVPPDGLVLISDAAKPFYNRVVSKRVDMSDLHGSGNNPHQFKGKGKHRC